MNLSEAIKARHSVRSYTDKKIERETEDQLRQIIDECNRESALHIQLCLNEPKVFSGIMARYGKFKNAQNYIALVGKKADDLEEKCGYYGEKIVLRATQLGLHTCWVAMTYSKSKTSCVIEEGEKLLIVISIGYGEDAGVPHAKMKSIEELCHAKHPLPDWFRHGMEAAQLAPTAMHQQKFLITLLDENLVKITAPSGFYTKIDLGIVKYHFEVGVGNRNWKWAD